MRMPSMGCDGGGMTAASRPALTSVIPNPRIEESVENVCNQIEEDDERGGHGQVRHHRIDVQLAELRDEVVAHPVEREDRLGDDRAAEQGAEVERRDGDNRDQ